MHAVFKIDILSPEEASVKRPSRGNQMVDATEATGWVNGVLRYFTIFKKMAVSASHGTKAVLVVHYLSMRSKCESVRSLSQQCHAASLPLQWSQRQVKQPAAVRGNDGPSQTINFVPEVRISRTNRWTSRTSLY